MKKETMDKTRKKIIKAIEKAGFKPHPKIYNTWRYENILCYFAEWREEPVFTHENKKITKLDNYIYQKILGRKPLTKKELKNFREQAKKTIKEQAVKNFPDTKKEDWIIREFERGKT